MVLDGICGVMQFGLLGGFGIDPAVVFPKVRDVIVAPAELLAKGTRKLVRSVDGLWVGIVVAQDSEHRSG